MMIYAASAFYILVAVGFAVAQRASHAMWPVALVIFWAMIWPVFLPIRIGFWIGDER